MRQAQLIGILLGMVLSTGLGISLGTTTTSATAGLIFGFSMAVICIIIVQSVTFFAADTKH